MIISVPISASLDDTVVLNSDNLSLESYELVLDEINAEYNISYRLPTKDEMDENGSSYEDMVTFYTSMSIDEFKNYILSVYETESNEEVLENNISIYIDENEDNLLSDDLCSTTFTKRQRYYYSTTLYNDNYIYVNSKGLNDSGTKKYTSITGYGEYHNQFPYYNPYDLKSTISSDGASVKCVIYYNKYATEQLITAQYKKITITFYAAGGNIRAVGSA